MKVNEFASRHEGKILITSFGLIAVSGILAVSSVNIWAVFAPLLLGAAILFWMIGSEET